MKGKKLFSPATGEACICRTARKVFTESREGMNSSRSMRMPTAIGKEMISNAKARKIWPGGEDGDKREKNEEKLRPFQRNWRHFTLLMEKTMDGPLK
ncbi:MAG: hypothetical protein ABSA46_10945 [Thermodesulfovibrionales bacterium]